MSYKIVIYKILARTDWENPEPLYPGSADDRRDGFIHLSTQTQLPGTLARHFAGQSDLILVAFDAAALGLTLKWEHAPKRGEDFPHLYAPLPKTAALWARAIAPGPDGRLTLPL